MQRRHSTDRHFFDRLGRFHLFHQVVIPIALDPEMGSGAKLESLNHFMVHVGDDARLEEFGERRACRPTSDEPRLAVDLGRIGKLAGLPDIVGVPSNEVQP